MPKYFLPDPQKTMSFGQGRETMESIVRCRPALINPLPPILCNPFDQNALHSQDMERKASLSSAYASSHSGYTPSRSTSPSALHSPLGQAISYNIPYRQASPFPNERLVQGPRCASCLERGEHTPLEPGRPCQACGTNSNDKRSKASRKKRIDRHQYSKSNSHGTRIEKASKDKTEAGRRFDHTLQIGNLQNQLLQINSRLPQEALPHAWKELKKNNQSEDVGGHRLRYNKENIFVSSHRVIEDSCKIIDDVIQDRNALAAEAAALLHLEMSPAVLSFVQRLAHDGWAGRVAESASHRGSHRFERPQTSGQRNQCRL